MGMTNISNFPFTKYMVNTDLYKTTKYDGNCYFTGPEYQPKKYNPKSDLQSDNNKNSSLNTLSEEQKKELTTKLNNGQSNMSMEEWDDFLLSLVDFGLITNSKRLEALGYTVVLPEDILTRPPNTRNSLSLIQNISNCQWNGNPLNWLDQLDFSYKKEYMYSEVCGYATKNMLNVRERISNISDIIKELMK